MPLKRSRLEIYLDVLKAISKGTNKPTRIMYRTNLSWKPLTKILESLVDQGLVIREENCGHVTYRITEKGKNILGYFNKAMESIQIK